MAKTTRTTRSPKSRSTTSRGRGGSGKRSRPTNPLPSRGGKPKRGPTAKNDYDAVKTTKKRRAPKTKILSEDFVLKAADRKRATATTQDLVRNFVIARWTIQTYLDYTTRFTFQPMMDEEKYPGLNQLLQEIVEEDSEPENFDIAGRHSRDEALRLSESGNLQAGDDFWIKLPRVGKIQIIEGDRVADPKDPPADFDKEQWVHGVKTSKAGRILQVCISNRTKNGGLEFAKIVPASHLWHRGYFDRIDQIRGVSPLLGAVNTYLDLYENNEHALIKAKLANIFGIIITSKLANDPMGLANDYEEPVEAGDEDTEEDADYGQIDIKEPFIQEMNDGDDMKIVHSDIPGANFKEYMQFGAMCAMKCLNVPYSLFDENHGNYYAMKVAKSRIEFSSKPRRVYNARTLRNWARWKWLLRVLDGSLNLSKFSRDLTVRDLKHAWIPETVESVDPIKDAKTFALLCNGNFDSFQKICRQRGLDPRQVIRENLEIKKYLIDECRRLDLPVPAELTDPNLTDPTDHDGENQ